MYWLLLITLSLGFYLYYSASKGASSLSGAITAWAQKTPLPFKIVGSLTMIFAFSLSITHYGFGTGILLGLTLLMFVASIAILLLPIFQRNNPK